KRTKANCPYAVGERPERDVFMLLHVTNKDRVAAPRERSARADSQQRTIARVDQRRQRLRIRARRRHIELGRRPLAQGFMRTLLIEHLPVPDESLLLRRPCGG